jgi:hypothetical protein
MVVVICFETVTSLMSFVMLSKLTTLIIFSEDKNDRKGIFHVKFVVITKFSKLIALCN